MSRIVLPIGCGTHHPKLSVRRLQRGQRCPTEPQYWRKRQRQDGAAACAKRITFGPSGLPHVTTRSKWGAAEVCPRVHADKTLPPGLPCGSSGTSWSREHHPSLNPVQRLDGLTFLAVHLERGEMQRSSDDLTCAVERVHAQIANVSMPRHALIATGLNTARTKKPAELQRGSAASMAGTTCPGATGRRDWQLRGSTVPPSCAAAVQRLILSQLRRDHVRRCRGMVVFRRHR